MSELTVAQFFEIAVFLMVFGIIANVLVNLSVGLGQTLADTISKMVKDCYCQLTKKQKNNI